VSHRRFIHIGFAEARTAIVSATTAVYGPHWKATYDMAVVVVVMLHEQLSPAAHSFPILHDKDSGWLALFSFLVPSFPMSQLTPAGCHLNL
jgi:hypothetical protein